MNEPLSIPQLVILLLTLGGCIVLIGLMVKLSFIGPRRVIKDYRKQIAVLPDRGDFAFVGNHEPELTFE